MDKTQINIFIILSFLIIITLLTGLFYFIFQFRKRKIQEELEKLKSINSERERIIKDLHDDLGGSLNSILIISDLILKQKPSEEKIYECVTKISSTSKTISQQIKTVIWSLDNEKDSLFNLIEFIKYYSLEFIEFSSIELTITDNYNYENVSINGFFRKNVFLIIKESLNNIVKHANASQINIEIQVIDKILRIDIKDNGNGIEKVNPEGNGLKNMKNRITEINGKLTFLNNNGTQICINVPLP